MLRNSFIGLAAIAVVSIAGVSIAAIPTDASAQGTMGRAVQRSLLNLMEKMDLRPPSAAA